MATKYRAKEHSPENAKKLYDNPGVCAADLLSEFGGTPLRYGERQFVTIETFEAAAPPILESLFPYMGTQFYQKTGEIEMVVSLCCEQRIPFLKDGYYRIVFNDGYAMNLQSLNYHTACAQALGARFTLGGRSWRELSIDEKKSQILGDGSKGNFDDGSLYRLSIETPETEEYEVGK